MEGALRKFVVIDRQVPGLTSKMTAPSKKVDSLSGTVSRVARCDEADDSTEYDLMTSPPQKASSLTTRLINFSQISRPTYESKARRPPVVIDGQYRTPLSLPVIEHIGNICKCVKEMLAALDAISLINPLNPSEYRSSNLEMAFRPTKW